MPELPEVETTIKGLKIIKKQRVNKIHIHTNKLRFKIPNNLKKILINSRISKIKRIAKYIILDLDNKFSIIIHLGMSGRLKINNKNYSNLKHDHLIINFENSKILSFNDPRKFGFVDTVLTSELTNKKYIRILGPDALSKRITCKYLYDRISNSNVPIKQLLLNQKIISGIGNIYASEILFDARISPLTMGKNLDNSKIMILIVSIKKILRKAIKYGGSSIRNYRSADGTLGNFQLNFKVYNKEGQSVGNDKVLRIVQYGRSTFYCPNIQS